MASYSIVRTTATGAVSATILHADFPTLGNGTEVEIFAETASFWVNVRGGTAAADGNDCVYVPKDSGLLLTMRDGITAINAIQESAAGKAVVGIVQV